VLSDRVFGLAVLMVALAYVASATQIQTSFLSDPVGPKAFPIAIGSIAALCGLILMLKPDPDPNWPAFRTLSAIVIAVVVLVIYAYTLKPFGFLLPTMIAAAVLSYQISPNIKPAIFTGMGLSVGLFVLFKFVLGLGLVAFPKGLL